MGHFVLSPREREKRDRRGNRGDESEGQKRERNRNESEETEEIKTFPNTLTCYKDSRPCPTISQNHLDAPVTYDTRHLHHTRPPPNLMDNIIIKTILGKISFETKVKLLQFLLHLK